MDYNFMNEGGAFLRQQAEEAQRHKEKKEQDNERESRARKGKEAEKKHRKAAGGLPVPLVEIQEILARPKQISADLRLAQLADAAWVDEQTGNFPSFNAMNFVIALSREISCQYKDTGALDNEKQIAISDLLFANLSRQAEKIVENFDIRNCCGVGNGLDLFEQFENELCSKFKKAQLAVPEFLTIKIREKRIAIARDYGERQVDKLKIFAQKNLYEWMPKSRNVQKKLLDFLEAEQALDVPLTERIHTAFAAANEQIANRNLEIIEERTQGSLLNVFARLATIPHEKGLIVDHLREANAAAIEALGEGPLKKEFAERISRIEKILHPFQAIKNHVQANLGLY